MATFYVIATPIGNLDDISFRALETLKAVDLILVEDTRVTRKLLDRYEIKTLVTSYHQHSSSIKVSEIIDRLKSGQNLALVSDAGTPGINDPGNLLIAEILKSGISTEIVPIPGSNAAVTALSISAFPTDKFVFLGFPPHKKGRKTFFKKLSQLDTTAVFYESPFRILKALSELPPDQEIVVTRELTKKFETIYRGKAKEIKIPPNQLKGEFVVVVKSNE